MSRSGMTDLIAQLRGMVDAGTADYSVNSTDYWTDDQLQQQLDQHRSDFRRQLLHGDYVNDGGTVRYYDHYFPQRNVEGTAGGTSVWRVENANGVTIAPSTYSVNLDSGVITFTNDTLGSALYLSGRSYDMERAAAAVWRQKAAHFAGRFDLKIDNHDMKRSQLYDQAVKMASQFAARAKPMMIRMKRVDVN